MAEFIQGPSHPSDLDGAARLSRELYGVDGEASFLPSDRDWNFLIESGEERWVLKLAHPQEGQASLDFEHAILAAWRRTLSAGVPTVKASVHGKELEAVRCDGQERWTRLLSWLPGETLAGQTVGPATWRSWGRLLAQIDAPLRDLDHPQANRDMHWDLARSQWALDELGRLPIGVNRRAAEKLTLKFFGEVWPRLDQLPQQVLHHDANEHNLIAVAGEYGAEVIGIFDLGDAVRTARVFEPAIAGAYAIYLSQDSPGFFDAERALEAWTELFAAYLELQPLNDEELLVAFAATCQRMVLSALTAEIRLRDNPDHDYARVHQDAAWAAIRALSELPPKLAEARLRTRCGMNTPGACEESKAGLDREQVLAARRRHTGAMLSLSYAEPLEIVRGRGTYLFDKSGRGYLDCVNNVCHVGHCHPQVVEAAQRQMARLNTNTRYLSDLFALYTEQLAATLPDPLEVVFLVNSGSEANELALRLAYAATERRGVIATNAGYHGNTQTLVDISAYKHDRKGGQGAPEWVAKVANPDPYRGPFRGDTPETAAAYVAQLDLADAELRERGFAPAAFIIEALPGCGGQNVPPAGYLRAAFERARALGAVAIADEVQIGFGRVGSHWWGFEEQGAMPDIVTMGKPIGNGHPMAAVVTTRAIADAFHTGMEWFNTFGGNPVSCATGLAVLDVIKNEGLRERALRVGQHLQDGLRSLAEVHPVIGDVRGRGMYLGAEFVQDRETREPDADRLRTVLEHARDAGVLLSCDGPHNNVLKIKPPIVFQQHDADLMLGVLAHALDATRP